MDIPPLVIELKQIGTGGSYFYLYSSLVKQFNFKVGKKYRLTFEEVEDHGCR